MEILNKILNVKNEELDSMDSSYIDQYNNSLNDSKIKDFL